MCPLEKVKSSQDFLRYTTQVQITGYSTQDFRSQVRMQMNRGLGMYTQWLWKSSISVAVEESSVPKHLAEV